MSQSITDIQDAVSAAAADHAPLNIRGRGTWMSAYQHASASRELSLWNYAGVQEYVPGNLTMTVRAGTTVREIAEIAGAENQWLPLDPFGDTDGTIGATVATCSFGPLVTAFGTPRDLVLGVEAVLGSGEIVRGGGRVVKNVAGYDLSRLLTGSWGTIGIITEVTVRLFAKQEAEASVAIALPDKREAAKALIRSIRTAAIYPWSLELIDGVLATTLSVGDAPMLLFRFGGNHNVVKSQLDVIGSLGSASSLDKDLWPRLAAVPHAWSLRLSALPSGIFETWDAAGRLITDAGGGFRSATPDRGIVRVFFDSSVDQSNLFTVFGRFAASAHATGISIVVEAMPSLSPLATFGGDRSVSNSLSSGIKSVFDPNNILNPGFLQQ